MNPVLSKRTILSFLILLSIIPIISFGYKGKHDIVISNVNVVDVITGKILKNKTVAIDNNRIAAIYDKEIISSDSKTVIDGKGKYLIPGLWDMHAHYKWSHVDLDPLLVANGITGIREMWGDMPAFIEVPKREKLKWLESPDIYSSGDLIEGNPPSFPSGCIVVTTTEEAVNAVKNQIDKKVDFIKIYKMLSEDCLFAVAKEAKKRNISFAGHVPVNVSIYKAIESGMASSEHLQGFLEGCLLLEDAANHANSVEDLLKNFSEKKFDSLCQLLAKSSMWICPTLTVNRALGYFNDSTFTADNRLMYIPKYLVEFWRQSLSGFSKSQLDDFSNSMRKRYLFELNLIGKMNKKGVKFIAGTDFGNPYSLPGFALHDELALMVKGGMSIIDVLRSSTINPAIFINRKADFGTIEVGKLASLVLLNKNPLENIENTKAIETVILRGKVYDRKALDLMLEEAKSITN